MSESIVGISSGMIKLIAPENFCILYIVFFDCHKQIINKDKQNTLHKSMK